MTIRKIEIADIEGFKLGNAENTEAGTGCTVIICEDGAVAGVDVRGGGPATRETDLLRSENTVDKVHAIVLSGGSAFGLEAASGVMRSLAEKGIGFKVDEGIVVPIVPGASLYDLAVGRSDVFPDVEMGRQAVSNAYAGNFETGNHGAGTGASVGKYMGYERAMKTGLGTFACGDDHIQVGAISAVNAIGDIYNGAGNIIAGLRTIDGSAIKGTIRVLKGMVHDDSSPDLDLKDIKTIAAAEALKRDVMPARIAVQETYQENTSQLSSDHAASAPAAVPSAAPSDDDVTDEKSAIVRAMMASYNQEQSAAAEEENFLPDPVSAETASSPEITFTPETTPEDTEDEDVLLSASVPDEAEGAEAYAEEQPETVVTEPDQTAPEASEFSSFHMQHEQEAPEEQTVLPEEAEDVQESYVSPHYESASASPAEVSQEEACEEDDADEDDGYVLTDEDKADLGYSIQFNTVISCVITNAILTKPQVNKLAQILHDAYARAIKPSHGTLDGDTIFVMSTCTQHVNFDAFAALATDVLQYAIIDGAQSAVGAYGLPAAHDIIRK